MSKKELRNLQQKEQYHDYRKNNKMSLYPSNGSLIMGSQLNNVKTSKQTKTKRRHYWIYVLIFVSQNLKLETDVNRTKLLIFPQNYLEVCVGCIGGGGSFWFGVYLVQKEVKDSGTSRVDISRRQPNETPFFSTKQ